MTTIFLHLPKTGGTTMSHALRWGTCFAKRHWTHADDIEARSYADLSRSERAAVGLLQGHFRYGVHEHCPGSSVYIGMMRDPVERIISGYYYTIETFPGTSLKKMSIEAYGAGESMHRARNMQVRRVAGVSAERAETLSGDELFQRAVHHVEEKFACLGVLERYDESLMVMRRVLDWPLYPLYSRVKKTATRPHGADIPPSTRASLADANATDVRFYTHVKQRLEEQVAAHRPRIERDLRRFRRVNSLYQQAVPPIMRLRQYLRN